MNLYEDTDYDDIDDELDLLELVSVDTKSSDQYLIFIGSNDEVYAINVSKVRELMVYKDLNMVKNNQKDSLIIANADIRSDMIALINFDKWFGNDVLEDKDYELIILAGFGGKEFGIIIKSVEYIVNITANSIHNHSVNNANTNFIAKIKLNNTQRLCTIFDCDKMLLDIFDDINTTKDISNIAIENNGKYILFADDSKYIRGLVSTLLKSMNLKSKIFENGAELLEELKQMEVSQIGLIITDLEMPKMDGTILIKEIRSLEVFNSINIIVHTNMSNDILKSSLLNIGASEIVDKIDIPILSQSIKRYYK